MKRQQEKLRQEVFTAVGRELADGEKYAGSKAEIAAWRRTVRAVKTESSRRAKK